MQNIWKKSIDIFEKKIKRTKHKNKLAFRPGATRPCLRIQAATIRHENCLLIKRNGMRKLIAAINMTLDGFCDHTAMIADDELHQHYNELLSQAGTILYGRVTYQLMESYWPTVVKNPTGNKPIDEFAVIIQNIPKIVFSHTLTNVEWENTELAKGGIKEEVVELKEKPGKDILVGSPSLIVDLTKLNLIDEYQLCVHPVIIGNGLPLFKDINSTVILKLLKTKTFGSGAITLYYECN